MGGAFAKFKPTFKYILVTRTGLNGECKCDVTIEGSVDDRDITRDLLPPEMAPEFLNPPAEENSPNQKIKLQLGVTTVLNCLDYNYHYTVVACNSTNCGEYRTEQWTLRKRERVLAIGKK